jgi:hypothetical protein
VLIYLAGLASVIALTLLAYIIATPEIVIVNLSNQPIEEVVVRLPSNRIVFGQIQANRDSTIYYSWSQSDGAYEYEMRFPGQAIRSGRCGYVTNGEIGKRLTLTVDQNLVVTCVESNKILGR